MSPCSIKSVFQFGERERRTSFYCFVGNCQGFSEFSALRCVSRKGR